MPKYSFPLPQRCPWGDPWGELSVLPGAHHGVALAVPRNQLQRVSRSGYFPVSPNGLKGTGRQAGCGLLHPEDLSPHSILPGSPVCGKEENTFLLYLVCFKHISAHGPWRWVVGHCLVGMWWMRIWCPEKRAAKCLQKVTGEAEVVLGGRITEVQAFWDVAGQCGIQGDVFAVLIDCHTGRCSSCDFQMFA